jgi:glycosyltransferase involved in cell wall biosynthesis
MARASDRESCDRKLNRTRSLLGATPANDGNGSRGLARKPRGTSPLDDARAAVGYTLRVPTPRETAGVPGPPLRDDSKPCLRILALEPWLRGSHEGFLAHWSERSRHDVRVIGLAARDWKWRMRSAAFELARRLLQESIEAPDVLFASDYVDLPALYGWLAPHWREIPCIAYFHENQLTYPERPDEEPRERDLHFGFTNMMSALRASRVVFNSRFHRDEFARASSELLARMPRPNPRAALAAKLAAAHVIAPGIDLEAIELGAGGDRRAPLRVLFNHRWEHDKDPLAFLAAVRDAARNGARLELVLLGESFETLPPGAGERHDELAPVGEERGFVADRAHYASLLRSCDVAVSTARHEFFGVAIAEAMAAGCTPLVPRRLAYPELVPSELHARSLYDDGADLSRRLERAAAEPDEFRELGVRAAQRNAVARHSCADVARSLDDLAAEIALESESMTRDTRIV